MSDHQRMAPLDAPKPEPFRRRQFVAPHRRRKLIFRLIKPFMAALAIVGLPSVLVGWILLSDQFAVRGVSIVVGDRVSAAWASERLRVFEGRNLLSVGVDEVERTLGEHPWVEGVRIDRRPPSELEVKILEKHPAALLVQGETLVFVDRSGGVIGPYDPGVDPGDLVVLSIPEDQSDLVVAGLALIAEWRGKGLPWIEGLSEVQALTATDFKVITAALPCPLFVSSVNLADGLASLVRYGPRIEQEMTRFPQVGAIDLRFHGRIVFQPAAPAPRNLEGETNA